MVVMVMLVSQFQFFYFSDKNCTFGYTCIGFGSLITAMNIFHADISVSNMRALPNTNKDET